MHPFAMETEVILVHSLFVLLLRLPSCCYAVTSKLCKRSIVEMPDDTQGMCNHCTQNLRSLLYQDICHWMAESMQAVPCKFEGVSTTVTFGQRKEPSSQRPGFDLQ